MMRSRSLAFRLFASAAAWTLIVLPVTAFVLTSLYRGAVERSFDARLNLYLTTLIANTSVVGKKTLRPPLSLGEPLFELPFSGWYWQIKPLGSGAQSQYSSESLLDEKFSTPSDLGLKANQNLVRQAYIEGPEGQRLRVIEREISYSEGRNAQRYSFSVAGDGIEIEQEISGFTTMLTAALSILGLGLVFATFFQVRFGLKPLQTIGKDLAAIRSGKAKKLTGDLPVEIEPLQDELNALIGSNRDIIERARTHVGNLAHALKTPLSIIKNEAHGKQTPLAKKVIEQTEIMRDQISHHLDRARVAAQSDVINSVSDIEPIIEGLVRAVERLYQERHIVLQPLLGENIKFQGDKHDLEEMIGNLLDNACKWAKSEVIIRVDLPSATDHPEGADFSIVIDDDGPGLSCEERQKAVKRGLRLDESTPGSGLGLAIVADLAHLYKGKLELEPSPQRGLRARLTLPTI